MAIDEKIGMSIILGKSHFPLVLGLYSISNGT